MQAKADRWNENTPSVQIYTYDSVGRLIGKWYNGKQSETLSYNVRGWLTEIESPAFSQRLRYTDGDTPRFNGNVSTMLWKSGTATQKKGYRFAYDGLSRMTNAIYGEGDDMAANVDRFNEQITGYDKMGNILGLLRYGQTGASTYGLIDNLNLTYDGNQLLAVRETPPTVSTATEWSSGTGRTPR